MEIRAGGWIGVAATELSAMKRYTGQKALYEAISRSRAKAKQHSILERLRPAILKPQIPAGKESQEQASVQTAEPVVEETPEPDVAEAPPQSVLELPLEAEPVADVPMEPLSEMSSPSMSRSEPVSTPRPVERLVHATPPTPVQTWLKPRPVQLNEGRIEVSVPYYVGAIAGIVLLMVVLVAYRLGQARSGGDVNGAAPPAEATVDKTGSTMNRQVRTSESNPTTSNPGRSPGNSPVGATSGQGTSPVVSQGDNWIVLVQHKNREDLLPVVDHFARNGIDLFILPLDQAPAIFAEYGLDASRLPTGGGFLLVTKKAYDNPNVPGSEGEKIVKRIAEVGALYKAQSGDKLFAPKYFSDAYGMRIRKPN